MKILAILFPPLAVLLCGKPFQALISIPLTICLWIPGVIHAFSVVNDRNADKRTNKLIDAIKDESTKTRMATEKEKDKSED